MFKGPLSFNQTEMMKHAWGYYSKEPGYRTRYCTQIDDPDMVHMVAEGYFNGPQRVGDVGENCAMYYLTDKGIRVMQDIKRMEDELNERRKGS